MGLFYEDLSLFNGDLLLEDASFPVVEQQGPKDGPSIYEAVLTPTPVKASVQVTLAHPQNGSQDLGLQDLLVASPTQDLPDPFTANSAWFDTKTDLLDLLTGVENQQPEDVQQVIVDSPLVAPAAVLPQQETSIESLEAIQAMLLADLPVASTYAPVESEMDTSGSSFVVYDATSPSVASNADIDILEELNQAGLEQLLDDAPDPNTASLFDGPILSPVSANDIESVLSSSPPSPSEEVMLADLFKGFTNNSITIDSEPIVIDSEPITLDSEQVGEILHIGPQRPVREKARTTPYTVRSATHSPSAPAATSSRKPKVDRRERKKEQNRTAALRYRDKKRSEQDILQQEADELMDANNALREEKDSIAREIKYLKNLMAEVQKARSKAKAGGAS